MGEVFTPLRVLIGGEYSGTIRDAFIARGHDAMSCDFSATTAPGPHYRGDWADIEGDGWDLAIFHRTCTYMANSGAKHQRCSGTSERPLRHARVG